MTQSLTRAAVDNRDLLQAIQAAPPTSLDGLAKDLNRDPSNLRKTIKLLEAEDLVVRPEDQTGGAVLLTEAGELALQGIAVAEGRLVVGGLPPLPHSAFRRDPNNPREEVLVDASTEALAENIARRGQKVPIQVRLDASGRSGTVSMGERRWRSIGLLIERGDTRWPADRPVAYTVSTEVDEAEILADAIIENVQRKDLHPIEEARAYGKLRDLGWAPGRIIDEVGKDRRYIELRLDLLNLTPAQQDRMRLDSDDPNFLSIKGARGLLQHLRAIQTATAAQAPEARQLDLVGASLDLGDKLVLALVELAFAIERQPSRAAAKLTGKPDGALATLVERQLVRLDSFGGNLAAGIPKDSPAALWLANSGFHDDPQAAVTKARAAVLGVGKAEKLQAIDVYATDELNTDPLVFRGQRFPNATLANQARIAANGGAPSNSGGGKRQAEQAVLSAREQLMLMEVSHKVHSDPKPVHLGGRMYTKASRPWSDSSDDNDAHRLATLNLIGVESGGFSGTHVCVTAQGVLWLSTAGFSAANINRGMLAAARQKAGLPGAEGAYSTPWLNTIPAGAEVDVETQLTGRQRLFLAEVADKACRSGQRLPGDDIGVATVHAYWTDLDSVNVAKVHGMVAFVNPGAASGLGWVARLTPKGVAYLIAENLLEEDQWSVPADALDKARGGAGQAAWPGPGYVTAMLNEPASPAPVSPLGEEEQDTDDSEQAATTEAAELLAKVRKAVAGGMFGDNGRFAFRDLMQAAGLDGPYNAEEQDVHGVGIIWSAKDNEVATVDTAGEAPDDLARARAELIAFALNAFAGWSAHHKAPL